jgi:GTP-binding protein LepA
MKDTDKIRNFAIIAHIDHGKSTLADRILEKTGSVTKREVKERMMDTLELEQEKGITIKLQTARMLYSYDGENSDLDSEYILNLIDTPGHVDFGYEVSRSLSAAQGALLLVDATQGIQAQTITNVYKALEYDLTIIPVINKIDLPNANIEELIKELEIVFDFKRDEIIKTSGKTGEGVEDLLRAIVERIPAPEDKSDSPLRALIFDTFYHEHKGVIAEIFVTEGEIKKEDELHLIGSEINIEPIEIGYLTPAMLTDATINNGEVGYIATGLKNIRDIHVGDTLTTISEYKNAALKPLTGYKHVKPMVFASVFPIDTENFNEFRDALEKLALNDAALAYTKIHSQALGSGFLCGYLGLLHMEVVQERLEREFNIDLITTSPSVEYNINLATSDYSKLPNFNNANFNKDGEYIIKTAAEFPDPTLIQTIKEPWNKIEIITPEKYIGAIMELAKDHRGIYKNMTYISDQLIHSQRHVNLHYEIPTAEIITTFFDKLKSVSQGYASLDYEYLEHRESKTVKVSILVNYEVLEALSFLSHVSNAETKGREVVTKLKDLIPRQQFKIAIQAAINTKVIARETIQAYRKDVTAKLYGGDVTRKRKLLEKQKKGKKRMKMFGSVAIPKDVFIEALKM